MDQSKVLVEDGSAAPKVPVITDSALHVGGGEVKVLELNGASKKVADACVGAYFPVLHQKYPAPQPGGILANVISKEVLKKTSLHCQPACTSVC